MKRRLKQNLITIIVLALTAAIAAGWAFGALNYSVVERYSAEEGTISYTISGDTPAQTDSYHREFTASGTSETLKVTKHVPTGTSYDASNSFDLLIYSTNSSTAISADGSEIEKTALKAVSGGFVSIYSNISYATGAADGTIKALTLSGLTASDSYKAVAIRHSARNVYIGSYFELKMLNDEHLHMLGSSNTFDGYIAQSAQSDGTIYSEGYELTQAASGTISSATVSGQLVTTLAVTSPSAQSAHYVIKVLSSGATTPNTLTGSELNGYFTVGDANISFSKFILNGITTLIGGGAGIEFALANQTTDSGVTVYTYADTEFGLVVKLRSDNTFTIYKMAFDPVDSQKMIYIINDFTVTPDADLPITRSYINIPCYINFLYATVTLNADFGIRHFYAGAFEIDAILTASHTYCIDNKPSDTAFNFTIYTPNGYYRTESVAGETVDGAQVGCLLNTYQKTVDGETVTYFSKVSELLAPETDAAVLSAIVSDARIFVAANFPTYAYDDVLMPKDYYGYVTYGYSVTPSTDSFNVSGNVTRVANSVAVSVTADIYFNGSAQGKGKNIKFTVVGTSASALASAFAPQASAVLALASENVNSTLYYEGKADLNALVASTLFEQNARFALDLSGAAYLDFAVTYSNGTTVTTAYTDKIEYLYSDGYTLSFTNYGSAPITVAADEVINIMVARERIVLEALTQNLMVSYTYSGAAYTGSQTVAINLAISPLADRIEYLNKLFEQLFFSGEENETAQLLYLDQGALKRGSQTLLSTSAGVSAITYAVYKASGTAYDNIGTLIDGSTYTVDDFISDSGTTQPGIGTGTNDKFTLENGTLTPTGIVALNDGQILAYVATVTIDGETVKFCRLIDIPEEGLGGSRFTRYTAGDTFSSYFNSLDDGKLIDSVSGASGSANKFASDNSAVTLEMTIVNAAEVVYGSVTIGAFCSLVSSTGETSVSGSNEYFQININISTVPPVNSAVQLQAVFKNGGNIISTQNYSFIIPGIYRYVEDSTDTNEVADARVYNKMIEQYDKFQNYLLVDGAKAVKASFDCSGLTGTSVNLHGIHLLTATAAMDFSGNALSSLAAFGEFTNGALKTLDLSNCGIDDSKLSAPTTTSSSTIRANLYSLTGLTTLKLNNNSITSLNDANGNACCYRTVTTLELNTQRDTSSSRVLSSLNGIENMPFIAVLHIESNAIASFAPLKSLKRLTSVYLEDNVAAEFTNKTSGDTNSYYGTNGQINIPVYVALIDRGVNVYVTSTTAAAYGDDGTNILASGGNKISTLQRTGALALNAIFVFSEQYSGISVPVTAIIKDTSAQSPSTYALNVQYVLVSSAALTLTTDYAVATSDNYYVITPVSGSFSNNTSVRVILGIDVDATSGADVFGEFIFTYKTTA